MTSILHNKIGMQSGNTVDTTLEVMQVNIKNKSQLPAHE